MVYYITGSNIFGQWLFNNTVVSEFRDFSAATKHDTNIEWRQANLLQINWSYNIFQVHDDFYITGAYNGKDNQVIKISLPEECISSKGKISVIGNDYKIILICKHNYTLWVIDLKNQNEPKKVKFLIEEPLKDNVKKQKRDDTITKAVITNDLCLYLTAQGNVYGGVLPSYVDTRHCRGRVIDIQCGYEHCVLLTDEGRVYTWGNGRRLQLGHGDISSLELPTEVEALAGIKITKISAGGWHSIALSIFGDAYAWGWNDTGQLGIKKLTNQGHESYSIPILIDLFDDRDNIVEKNIKDIACGSRHSALLLDDNTVWTTGCNNYGQLGFSEEKCPSLSHFKKSFHCSGTSSLMCGPWNTVIYSENS